MRELPPCKRRRLSSWKMSRPSAAASSMPSRCRATPWPGRPSDTPRARLGKATIDFHRREVRWTDKDRVELSETEAGILMFLLENQERSVSREEILSRLWGINPAGLETRTIDMHVARLRAKLRDPSGKTAPEAIVTVRAHGYMAGPDLKPE